MSQNEKQNTDTFLDGQLLAKMAQGGAAQLHSNAEEVNKLNVFPVPDGDTGDNMRMTIESGIAALENSTSNNLAEVMEKLSHGMLLGARGNSGVILSQFFAGVAKGLSSYSKADAAAVGNALSLGVTQAYTSVMTPTEGTILTVAREAVEYAVARVTPDSTVRTLFSDLVKEMYASLQRTPEILAVLKEAGVVDSGGAGLFYIMDGFYRVLNGDEIAEIPAVEMTKKPVLDLSAFGPDSEMTYGYCTELLLQLQSSKVDVDAFDHTVITEFLEQIGDSIVAFKTGSIVKLHVHTLTPDRVLGFCHQFGEFLTVKIENMSVQHNENEELRQENGRAQRKKYGIVSVATGDGISEIFRELGVDAIVEGGQTQNPSTNDFINAFGSVNAEHIFVFPNNGNIIMAAKQAAEIYKDASIHVVESKNLGAGYVALSAMDPDAESEQVLLDGFNAAIETVSTGYVSPSIRDAEINGVQIRNGDFIGFVGKEMLVAAPDKSAAVGALAERMLADGRYMMTVFYGKDSDADERAALESYMQATHPEVEAYFLDGGQDIYPFILVVE